MKLSFGAVLVENNDIGELHGDNISAVPYLAIIKVRVFTNNQVLLDRCSDSKSPCLLHYEVSGSRSGSTKFKFFAYKDIFKEAPPHTNCSSGYQSPSGPQADLESLSIGMPDIFVVRRFAVPFSCRSHSSTYGMRMLAGYCQLKSPSIYFHTFARHMLSLARVLVSKSSFTAKGRFLLQ